MKNLAVRHLFPSQAVPGPNSILQDIIPPNSTFNKQFLDLLKKIFVYDPNKRISALDALKHPWFREQMQDEGTEALQNREERLADAARNRAYRESDEY